VNEQDAILDRLNRPVIAGASGESDYAMIETFEIDLDLQFLFFFTFFFFRILGATRTVIGLS